MHFFWRNWLHLEMYASTKSTLWKWRETRWPGLLINKLAKCTTHLPDKSIITLDNTKILWKIIIRTFVYGLWVMFLFLRENNPIKTEITWLHLTQHCKHKELCKSRLVHESAAPKWVSVWNHWIWRTLCLQWSTNYPLSKWVLIIWCDTGDWEWPNIWLKHIFCLEMQPLQKKTNNQR